VGGVRDGQRNSDATTCDEDGGEHPEGHPPHGLVATV
jgi:hypothetical protein